MTYLVEAEGENIASSKMMKSKSIVGGMSSLHEQPSVKQPKKKAKKMATVGNKRRLSFEK